MLSVGGEVPFEAFVTPRENRPLCPWWLSENRVFLQIPSVMMTPLSSSLYFVPSGVSLSPFPLLLCLHSESSCGLSPSFFSPPLPASSLEKRRHCITKREHLRLGRIGIPLIQAALGKAWLKSPMAKKEKWRHATTVWPQVLRPLWICFLNGTQLDLVLKACFMALQGRSCWVV